MSGAPMPLANQRTVRLQTLPLSAHKRSDIDKLFHAYRLAKDRLSRVGFGWFEVLLAAQGKKVDVANPAQDDTSDLMADFMAIVYSFAARMYGLRSAKRRSNRVKTAMTASVDDEQVLS
jgi:predicted site-specific integrase-resolvase